LEGQRYAGDPQYRRATRIAGGVCWASEEVLRSAFDRSPSGMSVVDLDGRWLRINDAYIRMLGYEREDIARASFCDFTHPDDVAEDREFMAAAIAGELDSHEREKRYVCKDGSIVWARVRAEAIRDEAGEPLYFVSHLQDISERRAAQEQSRESERTLRSVIDNTPAMISVKGRDYRYRLVNREFERFFGVSSDRIVGRSDENILPASALDAIHAKDRLVLGGQTIQEEWTDLRDGHERVFLAVSFPLLDERGEINAVCVASRDQRGLRRLDRCHRASPGGTRQARAPRMRRADLLGSGAGPVRPSRSADREPLRDAAREG
jgi:PAS domain S-box-containing protein